jgi:uncharacterized membrane protein
MRAIGSLILKVSTVILLVIFIGFLAMVLSITFTAMSITAGVSYTAQYNAYGISYNNCLSGSGIFGYDPSACNQLLNVTNNTANFFIWMGNYTGKLSNPILWAIIFTIMTAGLYVTLIQGIQFGPNITIVKTKRRKK